MQLLQDNDLFGFKSSHDNFCAFVDYSMQTFVNPKISNSKERYLYQSYAFIREDFEKIYNSAIESIESNVDFQHGCTDTRHGIESFFDLFNLNHDPDYITVLDTNSDLKDEYKHYRYNKNTKYFPISTKHTMAVEKAKNLNLNIIDFLDKLMKISKKCNSYVHPNYNEDKGESVSLEEMLNINIDLLYNAYIFIMTRFNGYIPCFINCQWCYDPLDKGCFQKRFDAFHEAVSATFHEGIRAVSYYNY